LSSLKNKDKNRNRLQDFLRNPAKGLWTLALPMMAGMGVHIMYTIVDMLFIGRLGGNAIAAVAFNMPLFFFVLGLTFGLGSGVTASIARFIGSRQKTKQIIVQNTQFLLVQLSVLFSLQSVSRKEEKYYYS